MTKAGYYHAQGDPEGTVRHWDGAKWVGDPVRPQPEPALSPQYPPPQNPGPQPAQYAPPQVIEAAPGQPERSRRGKVLLLVGGGLVALFLLVGIIDAINADETETTTEPTVATATTAAPSAPSTTEFQGMMIRELIAPPDEAAFLDKLNLRSTMAATFSTEDLLGWAIRGCELGDQYVMGSQPFWVDVLGEVIDSETTIGADEADDLATAIANSSDNTVCTVTVANANE